MVIKKNCLLLQQDGRKKAAGVSKKDDPALSEQTEKRGRRTINSAFADAFAKLNL